MKDSRIRFSEWSTPSLAALLVAAATIPYLNGLMNGFVYDDLTQVLNNPYILGFHHLHEIFTTSAWSYMGQEGVTNYYRPLMTFGYLLSYQVFGRVAFGYHLVNLALHVAVVCTLFGVTIALFRRRSVAFWAALVFAFHPIHTESVAWIAGVTDLEVTLFCLLTFWLFVKAARPEGKRSEGAIAGMVVCFILALLSKEQALMLPLLATIYEHGYREDRAATTWKQKLARYDVLWLLSAAYVLIRIRVLGALAPLVYKSRVPWPNALLSAPALIAHYVWKLFWPWYLCAFYVFHKSMSLLDPQALAGVAVLAGLAVAFAALWKRDRIASFGLIWFLATLAPVLNARWLAANVFAERYLYLPSVGFCWVFGWCVVRIWQRAPSGRAVFRPAMAAAIGLLLTLSAVRIFTRNRDWSDDVRLYTRTLSQQPDAYPILNNLGTIYWSRGEDNLAEHEWVKAYRLEPRMLPVLDNLGLYYAKEGDYPRAVDYYQKAMRLNPAFTPAHLHLGVAYEKLGDRQAAEAQLRAAVALAPLNSGARGELGELYLAEGKDSQAEQQFQRAVEISPNVPAFDSLGKIYLRLGRISEASQAFRRALALNPFDSVAHFNLATIDAAEGRNDLAEKEYRAGLQTDPKNTDALTALQKLQHADVHEKKPGS